MAVLRQRLNPATCSCKCKAHVMCASRVHVDVHHAARSARQAGCSWAVSTVILQSSANSHAASRLQHYMGQACRHDSNRAAHRAAPECDRARWPASARACASIGSSCASDLGASSTAQPAFCMARASWTPRHGGHCTAAGHPTTAHAARALHTVSVHLDAQTILRPFAGQSHHVSLVSTPDTTAAEVGAARGPVATRDHSARRSA
jgi:hypothetical protein